MPQLGLCYKKVKAMKIVNSKKHRQHQIPVSNHLQTNKRLDLRFFKSGLEGKVVNKTETSRLVVNKKAEA